MAGTYTRRQLLLRREDGSSGGFVRLERAGERCAVEFKASGLAGEARAVLVRPGEGETQVLGTVGRQGASFTISAAEAEGCTQAAVVMGDKVLLVGGEGAEFARIRRWLAQAERPRRPEIREVTQRRESRAEASSKYGGEDAPQGSAQVTTQAGVQAGTQKATHDPQSEIQSETQNNTQAETYGGWKAEDVGGDDPNLGTAMEPAMEPSEETALGDDARDGWEITPFQTPGMPEQIEGRFWQGGEIIAKLYGIAGAYAPEPPPGLQGFKWENGFWIYVRK